MRPPVASIVSTKLIRALVRLSNFFSFAVVVRDRGEEDVGIPNRWRFADGQFVS
jgi:hypothetical protein